MSGGAGEGPVARRAVIAGNWKMHMGPAATREFFGRFQLPEGEGPELVVFPPSVSLTVAARCPERDPRVQLGVQNVHHEDKGAFTGEISVPLAAEAGATHVLVGHSERRHVFGESDQDVAKKTASVVRHGLLPMICLGETLEERRGGRLEEVLLRQLEAALDAAKAAGDRFLLAYEPVWAIGTGETATPDDAQQAHHLLRGRTRELLGDDVARGLRILYGGSVKPENAAELLAAPDVDGLLVGGASLDALSFLRIAEAGW